MKKVSLSVLIISVFLIFSQCTEENTTVLNPVVNTNAATSVTSTKAVLNGEVITNSEAATVEFEWGVTTAYGKTIKADQSPVPLNTKTVVTATLDSLTEGTTYHFRLVASSKTGTKFGSDMSFTTFNNIVVITKSADSITSTGALLNGEVTGNNDIIKVVFEWGVTTAYGNTDTALQSPVTGITPTNVSYSLTNLSGETTYHYRLVAVHSSGKTFGSDMSFTTLPTQHKLALIHTDFGNILIWLYNHTPLHKANFINLSVTKFYDNLIFHRVVPGFVIQGGDPDGNGTGGPGYTINAEIKDSLTHVYGAVGAARLGDAQNPERKSSGSQFYIVVNKAGTHSLDKKYTVFGLVINGMPAADSIALVPKDGVDKPLTDVVMTKVEVVTYTSAQLKSLFNFTIPKFD